MPDERLPYATAILESLAKLDEHVVSAERRDVLGEAIRTVAILPAQALRAEEQGPDGSWRNDMRSTLRHAAALLTRVVLKGRAIPTPSASDLLELVDAERRRGRPSWWEIHALRGRVAFLVWLCGELAHVSDSIEADCLGSLWALDGCLEFLIELDRETPPGA